MYGCTPIENLENGTHYIMGFLSGIEEKLSKESDANSAPSWTWTAV